MDLDCVNKLQETASDEKRVAPQSRLNSNLRRVNLHPLEPSQPFGCQNHRCETGRPASLGSTVSLDFLELAGEGDSQSCTRLQARQVASNANIPRWRSLDPGRPIGSLLTNA
jgi:hypothetical protein